MSTDKTGASDAKKNEPDKKTAAAKETEKNVAGSADAGAKAKTDKPEEPAKDVATNDTAGSEASSDLGVGNGGDDFAYDDELQLERQTFQFRGMLMAILIKLPAALAYGSQGKSLDEMTAFVQEYETFEERYVAVELIKSIAESNINDIPSGGYKSKVQSAMQVIQGTADQVSDIRDPHSQKSAADRLNYSIAGMELPPELERMKQENELKSAQTGTAEQAAAHARLYGS